MAEKSVFVAGEAELVCLRCNEPLKVMEVKLEYLKDGFPVELPRCPKCRRVFVDEELALGKMLRVERALEDK